MQKKHSEIILQPKLTALILGSITIFLVLANLFVLAIKYFTGDRYFYGLIPLFQLNIEYNIPTFFSGYLFLICSMLLLLIWKVKKIEADPRIFWIFLAVLFLFLAYDELFAVHERLIKPIRNAYNTTGLLYFPWVIVYGAGVVILACLFFPSWSRLNKKVKLWFALSAVTYLSGAIGLEMIGGAYFESIGEKGDPIRGVLFTIEESLEMTGLIMFVYSLLLLLQSEVKGRITLVISDKTR